ncbi:MAG TPA: N-acetylmuramoyl-L-alanine amidase [Candidatus Syntrophosphaera sp.]|nr:N-acetylmuramoyl-L-alanine amidase [Candidatus Syntrophosphaera sp.]
MEMGFISILNEEAALANKQYQERMSRTIFEGIKRFKYSYDRVLKTN